MKLEVLRVSSDVDSSSGLVFDITNGRKFLCYSLEDEYRNDKLMLDTLKNMVIFTKECYTFKMYQDLNIF